MKIFSVLILSFLAFTQVSAQGIEFFHGSFEDALAEAKSQGKLIFVDAYAEWCGPCKRMAKTVFKEEAVGDFYNQNFINMKIDMEKGEGPTLAKKYRVSAYPTFFFIDEDGKIVASAKGGRQTKQFISLGENALKKYDKSGVYAEEYESGKKTPELLRKYAYALLASNKEHLKIANEYLDAEKDLNSETNLKAIFDFATESDSRIFDLLIEKKAAIIKMKSETAFEERVTNACMQTVKKAAAYEFSDLADEAKAKMKSNYPNKAAQFELQADMTYGLGTTNAEMYVKASKKYLSKFKQKDAAAAYHDVAKTIFKKFVSDEKAMKAAEKFAKEAANDGNLAEYYLTYSQILYKNNDLADAIKAAEKAKELITKEKKSPQLIDAYLKALRKEKS
jgi:thiol-disulfide isomerase/thioredoxin